MNLYHFASCIDNSDNHMTFGGLHSLFVSLVVSFAPSLHSAANDAARATNKLYALRNR